MCNRTIVFACPWVSISVREGCETFRVDEHVEPLPVYVVHVQVQLGEVGEFEACAEDDGVGYAAYTAQFEGFDT